MTDKEIIRAEIEKRINTLEKNVGYGIGVDAQINAYACLLEFIDSMEKEPATSVWHEISEVPNADEYVAVILDDGKLWSSYKPEDLSKGWETFVIGSHVVKWAYVDDIQNL